MNKFLKPGAIEPRLYQETILGTAVKYNTLVVLPTGLGKTYIAALLAAVYLEKYPRQKILFLAPTKPLVEQHRSTWKRVFNLDEDEFQVFTGQLSPEKREKFYRDPQFIFATPQVIQNDIISNRFPIQEVSLLIIDEAHRAVGEYPYGFIAKKFVESSPNLRILALTASPGYRKDEIEQMCKALYIEKIESRSRSDSEVRDYIKKRDFEWVKIDMPKDFVRIRSFLEVVIKEYLRYLKQNNIIKTASKDFVRKKILLELQSSLLRKASQDSDYYQYLSAVAAILKVYHAIELVETQGIEQLSEYFRKIEKDRTKAAKNLLLHPDFRRAIDLTNHLKEKGVEHPKIEKLIGIISKEKKSIVFANYRATVEYILKKLESAGISAISLIGQSRGREGGITQKEQIRRLEEFREGSYQVLVATSIGEEGLDIPEVDQVVFYEPVPSAIRSIQRAGRTARHRPGKIVVLMTKGTRDEAYYWSSFYKERNMERTIRNVKLGKAQRTLDKFSNEKNKQVIIFADTRESSSGVLKELNELGVDVRIKRLDVADFQVSDRVGIERKSSSDFVRSLIDGRLLSQAQSLVETFERPVIIVEGENLYGAGNVHPNAVRGALASLSIDFKIPIIYTKDVKETAIFLELIAKREQFELKREVQLRGEKKPKELGDMQQFIVESLPYVGPKLAKKLLEHFGSVWAVFNASETELKKVENLGKKKARAIKKVILEKYKLN